MRLLLAFWLEEARVERLLDWREGVPLAKDAQGEQILFGKTATSQTSVNHVYEDAKPVFNVVRKNASDRASIRLEEGGMIIKVQETSGEAS